jgi:spoIIIJ-associated protein
VTTPPAADAPADQVADQPADERTAPSPVPAPDGAQGAPAGPAAPAPAGSPDPGRAPSSRVARLEEEGDVAADYLEELLDIVDLDGDIDIDVEDGRASLSIVGDADDAGDAPGGARGPGAPLRVLVGRHGDVLEALQELTRLAVQARTGERSRLMLDVAGYRAERREQLVALATRAAEEVRAQGQPVRLAPMNPFERKVVHDAVAASGLVSDSEGDEPARRVVVHPA